MATISFAKKDLIKESGIGKPEDIIPKIGMEVENDDGNEITLDITPNRPDLLDIVGLARQLALHSGIRKPNSYDVDGDSGIRITVGSSVGKIRPYIAGIVVKGANFTPDSIRYLVNFTEKIGDTLGRNRKKLAIGMHDLNAIHGNLTYDAAEDGHIVPLNSESSMHFSEVIKENAKGIKYSKILGFTGKRQLLPFLKDNDKTISLIPITNCNETKVTEKTGELFIDITGTDYFTVEKVADMLACSFMDSKCRVYSVAVEAHDGKHVFPKLSSKSIAISKAGLIKVIGYKQNLRILELCARSGYTFRESGKIIHVKVPAYRYDVLNDQDVYEDLLFAYGYDNVSSIGIASQNTGIVDTYTRLSEGLTEIMLGLGYTEAYNNYLTNERYEFELMNKDFDKDSVVSIKYAKTENISIMRTSIIPSLIRSLLNSSSEQMPYKIFEIGNVFNVEKGKVHEGRRMALVSEHPKADFSEMKACVASLLKTLELKPEFEKASESYFIEGRCAAIKIDGNEVGNFGEVHPKVITGFGLDEPISACEIDLDRLADAMGKGKNKTI